MHQVSSSTMFFFVSYMHIHIPTIMYCSRLFVNCFPSNTLKHDVVCWVTELHLMFVSAAVSEIHEWNQNKKKMNSEIGNLTPSLGIQFAYFLTRGTL